jgi:hypothetical protein
MTHINYTAQQIIQACEYIETTSTSITWEYMLDMSAVESQLSLGAARPVDHPIVVAINCFSVRLEIICHCTGKV